MMPQRPLAMTGECATYYKGKRKMFRTRKCSYMSANILTKFRKLSTGSAVLCAVPVTPRLRGKVDYLLSMRFAAASSLA
jgi:hypothetical protein